MCGDARHARAGHRLSAVKWARGSWQRCLQSSLLLHNSAALRSTCRAPLAASFFAQGEMTELDHRVPVERNQNPAKPSGLLYGIVTLVTSSSEPSGFVA